MGRLRKALVRGIRGRLQGRVIRDCSHADLITKLISAQAGDFDRAPVLVETGCGLSTVALASESARLGGTVYSCDYSSEKADALLLRAGEEVSNIHFEFGDSLESLLRIRERHPRIDFLFLDSAASAMHTFREFMTVEDRLEAGACLLIDNAALPNETRVLGPVRKGKIIVPYLLASPYWEVTAYPTAGDSMVAAVMHEERDFSDPAYEHPDYVDEWPAQFDRAFEPGGRRRA